MDASGRRRPALIFPNGLGIGRRVDHSIAKVSCLNERSSLSQLLLCLVAALPSANGQKLSHDELLEVLEIHSWRIPMPSDERFNWGFELVDVAPRKAVRSDDWMHPSEKALSRFRHDTGGMYLLTFKQREGTSSGSASIRPCPEAMPCNRQYSVTWHVEPLRIDDGKTYLIADVETSDTSKPSASKQLILVMKKYRSVDFSKDK